MDSRILPDPRRYDRNAGENLILRLAAASRAGYPEARAKLADEIHARLSQGQNDEIFQALRLAPSHAVYRHLWEFVCAAADHPRTDGEPILALLFAVPLVLVAGAKARVEFSGVVPDIGEVTALLHKHGAVGATRNFGLCNALCPPEALERLKPAEVYRWSADWALGGAPREFQPKAITVEAGREQAHLRFLAGAGITRGDAPSFLETAANIGAWGLPLTRALVRQLARPGLDLLPVARPPVSLLKAADAGRCAQLEVAFNLFASNALRSFRATVGEPTVVISAHRLQVKGAEIRISMSSALHSTLIEGFRWPLHPLDDLEQILAVVSEFMRDCRVTDVRFVEAVLPERLASGTLFLRADEAEALRDEPPLELPT